MGIDRKCSPLRGIRPVLAIKQLEPARSVRHARLSKRHSCSARPAIHTRALDFPASMHSSPHHVKKLNTKEYPFCRVAAATTIAVGDEERGTHGNVRNRMCHVAAKQPATRLWAAATRQGNATGGSPVRLMQAGRLRHY